MKELIKIKMQMGSTENVPAQLLAAINDTSHFSFDIESERNLESEEEFLFFKDDLLQFKSRDHGVFSIDFKEMLAYHQRQHYAITKEPLAKALGIKGNIHPRIWDTTCGTGKDALLMSFFGAHVTAFERHPVIYLLLQDALRRCPLDIQLVFADAAELYSPFPIGEERPEVIYYDPMYPEKRGAKKSALPRKEMQIFKEIVGADHDSETFLEWALKTATSRVVVKRALGAKAIKEKPSASYEGKSTRYDMYKIF